MVTDVQFGLLCECHSLHTDILFATVERADEMVAKALALSEVARIARAELRLREYLLTKWRVRCREAARAAGDVTGAGGTVAQALGRVDKVMSRWSADVDAVTRSALERVYRLARTAGHKKATGQTTASLQYVFLEESVKKARAPAEPPPDKAKLAVSFDLRDKRAISALQSQEMLWIGEHYGANVSGVIREAVTPKMIQGLGREAAGKLMQQTVGEKLKYVGTPSGWRGSDASYFEGLAANAVTNSRVQGQMESFARVKVLKYELVNPMDSRTTEQCAALNGTIFEMKDGMHQLEALRGAKTPDDVRSVHPWLPTSKLSKLASRGSKALVAAGQAFPPYHFRCRTTVDVAEESLTYRAVED